MGKPGSNMVQWRGAEGTMVSARAEEKMPLEGILKKEKNNG